MAFLNRRRRPVPLLMSAACSLVAAAAFAQKPGPPNEYDVKAAFVYNFGLFVEWPAGERTEGPFQIGVLGEDPLAAALNRGLAGMSLGERPLRIQRLARPEDAAGMNVLLIARSEERRLPAILKVLEGHAVLTVSDIDRFAERDGMIGFRVEDKRVRFDVNLERASRAGLVPSSQLLKLARIVTTSEAR